MSARRKISGPNWEFDGNMITVRIPNLETPRRPSRRTEATRGCRLSHGQTKR
jgi:hypothetical protein